MRKLIMWNVVTLDGYFEGETPWDLGFHQLVWGPELENFSTEQSKTTDLLVFGKDTYIGMAAYWTTTKDEGETTPFMNSVRKVVCSKTLTSADWNNTTIIRSINDIALLKLEGNGDMYVFGSGNLSKSLMNAGLFDEYRLCIAPVFLGKGKRLFEQGIPYQTLSLIESTSLSTGGMILKYIPKPINKE